MEFVIRSAKPEDRNEITRLLAIQLEEHGIDIAEDRLLRAVDGVFSDPRRGALWVGIRDGRTVAVAYISFIWAMEHGGHSAWLEELFVLPEFRQEGLGSKLLHQVSVEIRNMGCAAIDLEVESDHKRVESLYLRNGFRALSRARWVKQL